MRKIEFTVIYPSRIHDYIKAVVVVARDTDAKLEYSVSAPTADEALTLALKMYEDGSYVDYAVTLEGIA